MNLIERIEEATCAHDELKSLRRKAFGLEGQARKQLFERAQVLYRQSFDNQGPSTQVLLQPLVRWSDLATKHEYVIMYDAQQQIVYSCMTSRKGKQSRHYLERCPVQHLIERFRPLIF